jgi:hypothetical protein
VLIFALFIGINDELVVVSANSLTASTNVEMDKLKNATDFKLLTPYNTFESYKLEIKEPYPLDLGRSISKVRQHSY